MSQFPAAKWSCLVFTWGLWFLTMGMPTPLPAQSAYRTLASIGDDGQPRRPNPQRIPLGIPGEFETQAALVLSWKSDEVGIIGTLLEIGQLASKQAPVIVLVSSPDEREHAELAFDAAKINPRRLRFLDAPVDTIWARDFGPVVVRNADGSAHFVDSDYDDGDRPQDDN
ncbi:MAG: agmatine deiminase family protein, partial [Planctomycetaceae bacterium]|nr:agmatine deiminase family protein [Planctomycetaceae bacterium]